MEKAQITLGIIKPHVVNRHLMGAALSRMEEGGFRILAMKYIWLTKAQAISFYSSHQDMHYFDDLLGSMTSGPSLVLLLEKEDAVVSFRKLIGATNPAEAEEGSLRRTYGASTALNGFHGSDSDENAIKESQFFFNSLERVLTH